MELSHNKNSTIAIVLSTFNGAVYIAEQLDSLIAQTHKHWKCYIRDDGSNDNSIDVIKSYASKDPRVILLEDTLGNLGVIQSYFQLFHRVEEEYISACDQDDVWNPEKLERCLRLLQTIETDKKIPALVHSDSAFVDSHLNIIRDKFIGKRGRRHGLNGIIFANSVQGGSIIFNRALNNQSKKIIARLPYDYHLGLIAELTGTRGFISDNLLKYRQHNASAIARSDSELDLSNSQLISASLQQSLNCYPHIKHDFNQLVWTERAKQLVADYLYLFEGISKLRKLYILIKNQYTFYRRKDLLNLIALIIKHKSLVPLVNQ